MIKAVIFDYGGVIGFNVIRDIYVDTAKRFGLAKEDVRAAFHEVRNPAQRGEIGVKEFWERFAAKFDIDPKELERVWLDTFTGKSRDNEDVIDLIKKLKANGYKIGLITNLTNVFPSTRWISDADIFDDIVVSNEVGMRKPEPKIYNLALDRLAVDAAEAVFIDDKLENVEGARAVGMKGIHFRDAPAAQLKKDLEKLGVKIE
jgi:epoxide hydrolase-like predicted phosphatase